ncbi:hypothetical protein KP509_04G051000 [Ceratopteris richardii]|uniref:Uncharacterized protein n=1 Tax=Ceratopteris richardii TaxID=49495 RepID=A0A8T2UVC3_CERRI|nr:hypothetical protein KP509_04G051000 [Ceratopteris richardii]
MEMTKGDDDGGIHNGDTNWGGGVQQVRTLEACLHIWSQSTSVQAARKYVQAGAMDLRSSRAKEEKKKIGMRMTQKGKESSVFPRHLPTSTRSRICRRVVCLSSSSSNPVSRGESSI